MKINDSQSHEEVNNYLSKILEANQSTTKSEVRTTQENSCTDLINAAVEKLEEALLACCPCVPTSCQCNGSITSCLREGTMQFLNSSLTGKVTITGGVCASCQGLFNSDLIFGFLTSANFPFVYYSNTNERNLPQVICTLSAPSITMTGRGTFVVGGYVITGTTYTLTFGNSSPIACSFSLEVLNQAGQFLFSTANEVPCNNIMINSCS